MHCYNSRKVKKNDVFLCLHGGERYTQDVIFKGVKKIIYMNRNELAFFVNTKANQPSKSLIIIGVTGTNGKTSVCYYVHQVLGMLGAHSFIQGTINNTLTTPESLDTQVAMKTHLENGGTHFVMEVSSHGIIQDRVTEIDFNIKCLTNITQDHLDYHGSMEEYKRVKMSFLSDFPGESIYPEDFKTLEPIINKRVIGEFNQQNLKAAAKILIELGYEKKQVIDCLESVEPVKGRFELLDTTAPFDVIVDYAHTPDGLDVVLKEAKKEAIKKTGRLIVAFGCGGDRDREKRPKMAYVVSKWSDICVVTADNPRTENAEQIFSDIVKGFSSNYDYSIEENREVAIKKVVNMSKKNDVVVIAGKGHETYQIIGEKKYDFDDVKMALKYIVKRGYK